MDSTQTQVLVVGAGPAGLVAGIVLARYGVHVVLVEKRRAIAGLSRALVISTRSMEIIRSWGLEDEVRAGAAEVEPCGWVTHTLAAGDGTEIPLGYPKAAEAARVSPTRPAWAPQDHLEPILLAYLRSFPGVNVHFGSELVSLQQSSGGIRAQVRDRDTDRMHDIEALFVIGADGAHSAVRDQLGIRVEGPDALGDYQRVEFTAPLSGIIGDRRYGLNIITHPEAAGVLAPRGSLNRWGFSREARPGQVSLIDGSEEQLVELIATAVGIPTLQPRLERRSSFSFAAQLAQQYHNERGFIIGDAAHRMTPRGGTGMNTAIQDAYDLGWKLGWVVRGWANVNLLHSYETERRRVGLHNVSRSGDPDGARRDAIDALPWDLDGRLPHHWVRRGNETVSTLDLLGETWTALTGPEDPEGAYRNVPLTFRAAVTTHILDEATARSIGIPPRGALLLRPDGKPYVDTRTLPWKER